MLFRKSKATPPALEAEVQSKSSYSVEWSIDPVKQREACNRLLGLLIAQAHEDGMCRIRFMAEVTTGQVQLQYYGPRDAEDARWWDMTPAPPETFNGIIQAIVSATQFEEGSAPRGTFVASVGKHPLKVAVDIKAWTDVTLSW